MTCQCPIIQTLQEASDAGTGPADILRTIALLKQSSVDFSLGLALGIPQEISSQWSILNPFAILPTEWWVRDDLDRLLFLLLEDKWSGPSWWVPGRQQINADFAYSNTGCIVKRRFSQPSLWNWRPSSSWKGRRIRGVTHITSARSMVSKIWIQASCTLSTGYSELRSSPQVTEHGTQSSANYPGGWLRTVMTAVFGRKNTKILCPYWTWKMLVMFIYFVSITIYQADRITWLNGPRPNMGGHIVSWESLWVTLRTWNGWGKQSRILASEKAWHTNICHTQAGSATGMWVTQASHIFLE